RNHLTRLLAAGARSVKGVAITVAFRFRDRPRYSSALAIIQPSRPSPVRTCCHNPSSPGVGSPRISTSVDGGSVTINAAFGLGARRRFTPIGAVLARTSTCAVGVANGAAGLAAARIVSTGVAEYVRSDKPIEKSGTLKHPSPITANTSSAAV